MKITGLSNELEVTPRQIRRYKEELEQVGIYIESQSGKYGGYRLEENNFPFQIEQSAPIESELIASLYGDATMKDIKHIFKAINTLGNNQEALIYFKQAHSLSELKNYLAITQAIQERRSIAIDYLTKNAHIIKKDMAPYFVFKKYGIDYLCGLDDHHQKLIYLRLSRMQHIQIKEETFIKDLELENKEKQIIAHNAGVFSSGDLYTVTFTFTNNIKDILEDIFDSDISFEQTEDKVLCTIKAGNLNEIKHKMLSFGSQIEVISPKSFRHDMMNESIEMTRIYKKATSHE